MTILLVAARWVHFAALFLVFGGALFPLTAGRAAPGQGGAPVATLPYLRPAVLVAALSGVAWLAGTIAFATGGLSSLADGGMLRVFFLETPFGPIAVARLLLMAALVLVAWRPPVSVPRMVALLLVSGALLVSQAWLGHAAEGGDTARGAAMILSYAAHVLAGAAWLGGLVPLARALGEWRRGRRATAAILKILWRFSALATAAVGVIVVSGVANTVFHTGPAPARLVGTAYGTVLLAKLALVALMLVSAGFNRFVVMPRLGRVAPTRWATLGLAFEIGIGGLVLGAAAVLGITPPP